MEKVKIVSAAVAHPPWRVEQEEAAARIAEAAGSQRSVQAIARGSQIESRALVVPADQVGTLGSIAQRNAIYEQEAPRLALQAACGLSGCVSEASLLVTTSCTGYLVPGLDVRLAQELGLSPSAARLPVTEAGCAGGVVAVARATDYLRTRKGSALVVAAELCSLAFHADDEEGNLISALLFADGAGALLLDSHDSTHDGLEVVDSTSMLVPGSRDLLGFKLTDAGFYPLLARNLAEQLPEPVEAAVSSLLRCHELAQDDIGFWLVHPGGPRVLQVLQGQFGIPDEAMRWSWETLRCSGNTSSAAIIEVITRYLQDDTAPRGWGLVIAFGPGLSIETLLVQRC